MTFIIGFGMSRFLVIHNRTDGAHSSYGNLVSCFLTPWRTQFIEEIINSQLQEALLAKSEVQKLEFQPSINNHATIDD